MHLSADAGEIKIDRQKIKRVVMNKFVEKFSTEVSHMMHINGSWTIKFRSLGTTQEVHIIPNLFSSCDFS